MTSLAWRRVARVEEPPLRGLLAGIGMAEIGFLRCACDVRGPGGAAHSELLRVPLLGEWHLGNLPHEVRHGGGPIAQGARSTLSCISSS